MRLVAVLICVSVSSLASASAQPCAVPMTAQYETIRSKQEINQVLARMIVAMQTALGRIDWNCLIEEFESAGQNNSVQVIAGGGFNGADIIRFTVDNRNVLSTLLAAPGASNGIFTAIVNRADNGNVAIVERGGKLKWLKLE